MGKTIDMAIEAGMTFLANVEELRNPFLGGVWLEDIENFEALVRADEQKAIISRLLEIGALEDGAFIEAIQARGQA